MKKSEALFYQSFEEKKVKCLLCPNYCQIEDGKVGLCRVRKNEEGWLYSLTDGLYLAQNLDPIEKKPLNFFKKGTLIYSIASAGCNLRCDFCQNHELVYQDVENLGDFLEISDDYILEMAEKSPSIGIAFTYNEPTINYEAMLRLAKKAKKKNLTTVAISNAYLNEKPIRELARYIDAWNIDLKSISKNFYRNICGGDPETILRNIAIVNENSHVEVTNLLIDGENTSDEDIENLAHELSKIDRNIPLHLTRYFPAYKRTTPPTKLETMYRAKEIAQKHLNRVVLGNC